MNELNFEEKMKRIDEIVKIISDGNLSLEENMKLYEEGQKIIKELETYIKDATSKIEKIVEIEQK